MMLQLETVSRKPGIRSIHQVHIGNGLGTIQGQGRRVLLLLIRDGRRCGDDGDARWRRRRRRRQRRGRARVAPAHHRTMMTIPRLVHDRHRRSLAAPTNCKPPFRLSFISLHYECSTGSRAVSFRPGREHVLIRRQIRRDFGIIQIRMSNPSSIRTCARWGQLKWKVTQLALKRKDIKSILLDYSEISLRN